ncbi:MAG: cytochrome c-type biogenesis CcmF C-terminal domain-containing protein [Myxococcota bacterium]
MPAFDIPFLGTLLLCLILVSAAYTMAMAMGAGSGRPHLLPSARWGTYATCAFVLVAVCVLAYAFQTHDFRIRYVARYSDRSMPWWYLIASLWGGQDGSLLWWAFLLCGYTFFVTRWLRGRYVELQPWILATLMSILIFFIVLMLFAANPFATYIRTTPGDGEGLNPLLQNYWMAIHPPSLYMGFVGWSVPFAILVAALVTGRLGNEWVRAARLWSMIAWTFLSLGLLLGCLWSYEELGWGGYWAWDPVENASFMPWLVGTAYLHSVLIQERRHMMKVWNVFLLALTFFLTIFGTFLTRSGLIASVHSFARSDIGQYFVWYLVFLAVAIAALMIWRVPKLKADNEIESLVSREFAFLLNNWVLLGMMLFVLIATTFPLLSEWLRGEEVTVGPGFYNKWMVPLGIVLLFLAGVGPLVAWRKATGSNLLRAMLFPLGVGIGVAALQFAFGARLGYPPIVEPTEIYDTATGTVLAWMGAVAPVVSFATCGFVLASIGQEFWRGMRVRMRKGEGAFTALGRLVSKGRRRYGGYIVHIGVVFMFIGFTGAAYDVEEESALRPGESMTIGSHTVRYDQPRMEADPNKRMVFTDMTLLDGEGREKGGVAPAKFIYRTHPQMPTSEVAIRSRPAEDVYVIMSTVDPSTRRGTFRVIVRPLVAWIWFGGLVLLLGAIIGMWPNARELVRDAKRTAPRARFSPATAVIALAIAVATMMAFVGVANAQNDSTSSLHAGSVVINDPVERQLFGRLLCQCGDCARLPLDTCACGWADDKRSEIRELLSAGETPTAVQESYRAEFGAKALAIPSDQGLDRALWAVPVAAMVFAVGVIVAVGRRWQRRGVALESAAAAAIPSEMQYDEQLDEELARFEEDT